MDRIDYFFRQLVTDEELDQGFDFCEAADLALASDHDLVRLVSGYDTTPGGGLTVDVTAGTAYDKDGRRLVLASLQNVDISVDHLGVPTAVVNPGNERVVSVFVEFDRELSDPRTDGNGDTVDYLQEEAVGFHIVAGVEAPDPAPLPPVDATRILIADITIEFGTAAVTAPMISTARREHAFDIVKTNFSFTAGTALEAVDALADEVDSIMGTESITLIVPATVVWKEIGGTGTTSLANSNRTVTTLGSTEQLNVPIVGLQVGDVITEVTARFNKSFTGVAQARVEEFFPDLTENVSSTASTPALAGPQTAVVSLPNPAFFPKTVVAGASYFVHMYAADAGDYFVSVEVDVLRQR